MKRTIKQRFISTGAFTVALMLLGYSVSIQTKGKEEVSLKDEITFIEIESPGKFEVPFKEKGRKTGIIVFESNKDNFHWEITIKKGDGTVTQIEDRYVGIIYEAGTVDLSENENEDIFFVAEWRKEYNQVRSHSALNYRAPAPEAIIPLTLT